MNQPEGKIPLEAAVNSINALRQNIARVLIGQQAVSDMVIAVLIAGGHVLLEGVPGLGKTMLVRALARSVQAASGRIQFTPDLMPSDVIGHSLYDMQSGTFQLKKGPAFTNILLADEINRAPAKTQAALLEVMQEQQITIDGHTLEIKQPHMVLATQNPLDQEGTYPLPEAELDRFMVKLLLDYPTFDDELALVKLNTGNISNEKQADELPQVINSIELLHYRELSTRIIIDEKLQEYALNIVRRTRDWPGIRYGASVRASINLIRLARVLALMDGRDYVLPDDIKKAALPILRHRILLSADAELEGYSADQMLMAILAETEVPRQ